MKRQFIFLPFVAFVIISVIILNAAPTSGKEIRGVSDDIIKVGVILDLTGPTATIQVEPTTAIRYYFRYLNEQGGVNGRKVKLIVEDDRFSIPAAIAAFKKLVYRDKVFAIIGTGNTGASVALLSQFKKEKILAINPSCSEIFVNPPKRYVFVFSATYQDGIRLIFSHIINDLKDPTPKIAFVYSDNEMGKTGRAEARRLAKVNGFELAREEVLSPGALDASSQVLNLKRSKANYVVMHSYISNTVALLRDSKKYGYNPIFFGTQGTCMSDIVKMAGEAAKNFISMHSVASWYDDNPGIAKLREVTLKYKPGTEGKHRHRYYTVGWLMCIILHEGMKRAGRNLDGENIIEALESIKDLDTNGVSAPITYGPNDRKACDAIKFFKADVDKGLLVPMTGWKKVAE